MSDALSNDMETHLLKYTFSTTSVTRPQAWYIGLHTSDPTDAASNEISGNGYARQSVTFSVSGNTATTNATVTFPAATGSTWGVISHCSIWTAQSAGTMIAHSALTASKTIAVGDILQVASGSITVSLT